MGSRAKVTTQSLREMKSQGEKIVALTAYDFITGALLDSAELAGAVAHRTTDLQREFVDIVRADITRNAGKWTTSATIDCKGVDIRSAKFPYPVQHLVGRVEIRDGVATCQGDVPAPGQVACHC